MEALQMQMDAIPLKGAVEAMLFAHAEPLTPQRLAEVLETDPAQALAVLRQLQAEYDAEKRGIALLQLEDAWQLATRNCYAPQVKAILDKRRNMPLSSAALEVLAVIAYNQPVSRSFIEQVRGVDSSSTVTKLLERGLVEEAGRLDLPGRPLSFRTTDVFLRTFGISSVSELPKLHDDELTEEDAMQPEEGETGEA